MKLSKTFRLSLLIILVLIVINAILIMCQYVPDKDSADPTVAEESFTWEPPDTSNLGNIAKDQLIRYGRELIANTSYYLGPKGTIAAISNGMNCQNCHLDAGTRIWGNNYSAVFSTYPRFRQRSGSVENIYKRVNDCIERSLNGKILDTNSREMQAFTAYINWLGHAVPKNIKPRGVGIANIPFIEREASPSEGQWVYMESCQRCHGPEGQGVFNSDSTGYIYPPLWGEHSYNTGAGLFRISRFAGYVRLNMPYDGASKLSDQQAWDVAAFVNSQPRPKKTFTEDWPDISGKPIDHPFGPYADNFSERQHKYGPFGPISEVYQRTRSKKAQ